MMFDKLIRRYLAENTTDELKLVPTISGAKALLARISSGRPEGFSLSERTDQLQLVREGSLLNFSKIIYWCIRQILRGESKAFHRPLMPFYLSPSQKTPAIQAWGVVTLSIVRRSMHFQCQAIDK
jgi:hypothetical protein